MRQYPSLEALEPRLLLSGSATVSLSGGVLTIDGTSGDDNVRIITRETGVRVRVNGDGVTYDSGVNEVSVKLGRGDDHVKLDMVSGQHRINFNPNRATLSGTTPAFSLKIAKGEKWTLAGDGDDRVNSIDDNDGDDLLVFQDGTIKFTGLDYQLTADGLSNGRFTLSGQVGDQARLLGDSSFRDLLTISPDTAKLRVDDLRLRVDGFSRVFAEADNAVDRLDFDETLQNQVDRYTDELIRLSDEGWEAVVKDFDNVTADWLDDLLDDLLDELEDVFDDLF